ncbi:hypothetical protein DRO66_07495 [Candidatus Bathyarchaeota archaeon]|nr:MAG: hypothetical protein DRO66_07495 [Candidatus Bathyarchaeota archaeon]
MNKDEITSVGLELVTMGLDVEMKITDYPRYEENPFIKDLVEHIERPTNKTRVRRYVKREGAVIDKETGVIGEEGTLLLGVEERVDNDMFIKIYKAYLQVAGKLSMAAIKIFFYICEILPKGVTHVYLSPEEVKENIGIKQTTFYKAIKELLVAEMLSKTPVKIKFFVNPLYAFNGNRMKIVAEFNREQKKRTPKLNNKEMEANVEFEDEGSQPGE